MCQTEVSSSNQITDDAALWQSRGIVMLQAGVAQSCLFIHAFPLADSDIALSTRVPAPCHHGSPESPAERSMDTWKLFVSNDLTKKTKVSATHRVGQTVTSWSCAPTWVAFAKTPAPSPPVAAVCHPASRKQKELA